MAGVTLPLRIFSPSSLYFTMLRGDVPALAWWFCWSIRSTLRWDRQGTARQRWQRFAPCRYWWPPPISCTPSCVFFAPLERSLYLMGWRWNRWCLPLPLLSLGLADQWYPIGLWWGRISPHHWLLGQGIHGSPPPRCRFGGSDHFCRLLCHVVHRVHGGLPNGYVECLLRHDGVDGVAVCPARRGCALRPCCCYYWQLLSIAKQIGYVDKVVN